MLFGLWDCDTESAGCVCVHRVWAALYVWAVTAASLIFSWHDTLGSFSLQTNHRAGKYTFCGLSRVLCGTTTRGRNPQLSYKLVLQQWSGSNQLVSQESDLRLCPHFLFFWSWNVYLLCIFTVVENNRVHLLLRSTVRGTCSISALMIQVNYCDRHIFPGENEPVTFTSGDISSTAAPLWKYFHCDTSEYSCVHLCTVCVLVTWCCHLFTVQEVCCYSSSSSSQSINTSTNNFTDRCTAEYLFPVCTIKIKVNEPKENRDAHRDVTLLLNVM